MFETIRSILASAAEVDLSSLPPVEANELESSLVAAAQEVSPESVGEDELALLTQILEFVTTLRTKRTERQQEAAATLERIGVAETEEAPEEPQPAAETVAAAASVSSPKRLPPGRAVVPPQNRPAPRSPIIEFTTPHGRTLADKGAIAQAFID